MPIYEFAETDIFRLDETTFNLAGLQERRDLQRLLREHIEVIAPNSLVIAEEFGDWDESRRRIDLLAIDKEANLVVIELKRTEDGGHMELQSIRYASMVSTMTFDQAANAFGQYLKQIGKDDGLAAMTKIRARPSSISSVGMSPTMISLPKMFELFSLPQISRRN